MLTFDEFRAVSKRERDRENANQNNEKSSINANYDKNSITNEIKKIKDSDENKSPIKTSKDASLKKQNSSLLSKVTDNIGDFLESYQMQFLYVSLIILDTFVSLGELYISYEVQVTSNIASMANIKIIHQLLNSFNVFTMIFFVIEIITVFIIFGFSIFTHWGYALDILTIGYQLFLEHINNGKLSRLFNILRFWRLIRLFNAMLAIEKDLHSITLMKFEASEIEIKKLNIHINNLKSDIIKEKEARNAIEDMLQNYKEEVDTLNEALKIAAMDIAEVAQTEDDFLISDDDEDNNIEDIDIDETNLSHSTNTITKHRIHKNEDYDNDDELYVDATASKFSKKGNKTIVMRAVMDDANTYNSSNIKNSSFNSNTYLVHEDGTFEQK